MKGKYFYKKNPLSKLNKNQITNILSTYLRNFIPKLAIKKEKYKKNLSDIQLESFQNNSKDYKTIFHNPKITKLTNFSFQKNTYFKKDQNGDNSKFQVNNKKQNTTRYIKNGDITLEGNIDAISKSSIQKKYKLQIIHKNMPSHNYLLEKSNNKFQKAPSYRNFRNVWDAIKDQKYKDELDQLIKNASIPLFNQNKADHPKKKVHFFQFQK